MKSYLTHLECTYCSVTQSADVAHRVCPDCGKVLYPRYDLALAKKALDRSALKDRAANMWRYFEVMPILDEANVITLGEGYTPIFQAARLGEDMGASSLYIKDEGLNPTASFKARGLSAAVSKAKELGITKLTMPSAGNAAGAMTSYAAKGGMEAYVFMPKDVPEANRQEVLITGGNLTLVDGLISDAGQASKARAAEEDLFDVSTLQEPYRVEGKKTMGYEIVEQLGFEVPDVVVYPTGGGTGIVGIWKALDEMEQMGWIGPARPRMVCVQAEGCPPLVNAYKKGEEFAEPFPNPATLAAGMRVPAAVGDFLVIRAVRESGGTALTVNDEQMVESVRDMSAFEGIFPAPEGGATLAALELLLDSGEVQRDDRVVLLNTGSALKYLDVLAPALGQ
ncbi:MAG: threonine synthase [SAR202 cluster bacterium]|nr:threonine synthase [SAR202 cluster bacterium]